MVCNYNGLNRYFNCQMTTDQAKKKAEVEPRRP